jgi:integrase
MPAVRGGRNRIAAPDECAALLEALSAADRPIWATAMYAGLRRGELMALRVEDVDLATGVIRVCRGWDTLEGVILPKNGKERRVPIAAVLRDYLDEHLLALDWTDGLVFGASAASLMIAAGVNGKALSTYMGHANISITLDRYGHLMPGNEGEAAGLLDVLLDVYLARASEATATTGDAGDVSHLVRAPETDDLFQ